ncbi:hypothetical protein, partial [Mycobacterium simiae]|uniref:hypothetical protein n=1 Tax=Mycobacterium simiae TaxID=1784 RepID=UPI00261C8040
HTAPSGRTVTTANRDQRVRHSWYRAPAHLPYAFAQAAATDAAAARHDAEHRHPMAALLPARGD